MDNYANSRQVFLLWKIKNEGMQFYLYLLRIFGPLGVLSSIYWYIGQRIYKQCLKRKRKLTIGLPCYSISEFQIFIVGTPGTHFLFQSVALHFFIRRVKTYAFRQLRPRKTAKVAFVFQGLSLSALIKTKHISYKSKVTSSIDKDTRV